jgi:hypothetical protein
MVSNRKRTVTREQVVASKEKCWWKEWLRSEKRKKRRRNRHLIVALFDGVLVVMKLGNLVLF